MNGMDGMGGGMMLIWMLIWGLVGLAIFALAVAGSVWLVRHSGGLRQPEGTEESPEEIVRRRYAAGELDEDEYHRRRAGLQN